MVFKARTFYGETPEGDEPRNASAVLERRVAEILTAVPGLDASNVQATVDGGTVTLTGYVSLPEEIDRATDAARAVEGVSDVENRLILPETQSPA